MQRHANELPALHGVHEPRAGRRQRESSNRVRLPDFDAEARAARWRAAFKCLNLSRTAHHLVYVRLPHHPGKAAIVGRLLAKNTLGFNRAQCAAAVDNVIGRMAALGSELATWGWIKNESALGEMLEFDFQGMSLMRLYRASDLLLQHQEQIETFMFERVRSLLALESTVTLYDLTNTYFEGALKGNPKAARGHSKEQRSEALLLTLGLVLDHSGFIRRSQVFAGNAVEARTLETMLKGLQAPAEALVVMDRGIATEQNLTWLKAQGYRYLVVSRERARQYSTPFRRSSSPQRADSASVCTIY